MRTNRRLLLAAAVAIAAGLAGLVGSGSLATTVAGLVVGFAAAWLAGEAARRDRTDATPPSVERAAGTDPPGATLAAALDGYLGGASLDRTTQGTRSALTTVVVSVLTRYDGRSAEEARAAVAEGTWTEDTAAARFLAAESAAAEPASVVSSFLGGDRDLREDVRRVVDEAAAIAGVAPSGDADPDWFSRRAGRSVGTVPSLPPDAPADRQEPADDQPVVVRDRRDTGHWRGLRVLGLATLAVGVLARAPAVVLLGALPLGYLGVSRLSTPEPPSLSVERSLEPEGRPTPGDRVVVTLTVTNEGDRRVPDCRLVDGVPAGLAVVEGTPRRAVALAPGESVTVRYAVEARRGTHEFGPLLAYVRGPTAVTELECLVPAATSLRVDPGVDPASSAPLRRRGTRAAGEIRTGEGGAGLTFHATREYRRGDPLSRIDWRRWARTGELATVEFERDRAATVVFVVDTRAANYVAPTPGDEHAVDRSLAAVASLSPALTAAGNRVGLTAVSTTDCWVPPGLGRDHRVRLRETLATHPALTAAGQGENLAARRAIERLHRRLPTGAQVVLVSPLCDDYAAEVARRFEVGGHPTTVVSPDPTTTDSPARTLARVARRNRVHDLREAGVRVVDWRWDEPLPTALQRGDGRC
ncbi:DUF58 domain-containing protein [Haloarchaeobius amylolyticus]|uniref:DUF58 domain-containing protein n=1 Tax=Haloarchaeobius amylolyticus TaxID=1198296 RepID=UPI00227195F1|nr:DUF58 domain-containing protein [Haloarchaeobius amylolyticus]